jgi:transposase
MSVARICPVEIARDLSALRAARVGDHANQDTGGGLTGDWQAAEIIGISDRSMRRWRERDEENGYDGLFDRRRGQPSPKRVPLATVEQVLGLYRDRNFDLNVQHFHEKLGEQHGIELSYAWVKCRVPPAARRTHL